MKKSVLTIILLLSLVFSACTASISKDSLNLMDDIQGSDLSPIDISKSNEQAANKKEAIMDFSLELFNENFEGENILISPLSIVSALGMVTNGAKDNTLSEMEEVLNSDIQGLNDYLKAYSSYLPSDEAYKVSLANSIWFKDEKELTVNKDFLQINKDYYDADVYKAPFDENTKKDINAWVKDKTKGMIDTLLEGPIPEDAIMYLINALSFDAEWEKIYSNNQIHDGDFTLENNEIQVVEFMSSSEFSYLENDTVTGFTKPYKDNKYAFVALLPKDNISMSELLSTLDGETLMNLLENKTDGEAYTKIPKFSVEYDVLLNDSLQKLGMVDAFNGEKANFTDLGQSVDGNIYISRVIHKTKIDVDEKGTKAGAVTAVEMVTESAMIEEPKEVILNRPFFYMIIDTEQNLPLFMGSLMNVK